MKHTKKQAIPQSLDSLKTSLQEKYRQLVSELRRSESMLIAFSGGVDSTLLTYVAHEEPSLEVLAVTAASETYPTEELREARELAEKYNFNHRVVNTSELALDGYAENQPDRCFVCRDGLFHVLHKIAEEENFEEIAYGENASDGKGTDYRPGQAAARKHEIKRPLADANLKKDGVRNLSRAFGLPNWDKPELACLSSRFPYGEEITKEKLEQVEKAEDFIKNLGFRQVRVRHHGEIARIEVFPNRIEEIVEKEIRDQISEKLEELGYTYISLDLRGYETGSLNKILQ